MCARFIKCCSYAPLTPLQFLAYTTRILENFITLIVLQLNFTVRYYCGFVFLLLCFPAILISLILVFIIFAWLFFLHNLQFLIAYRISALEKFFKAIDTNCKYIHMYMGVCKMYVYGCTQI